MYLQNRSAGYYQVLFLGSVEVTIDRELHSGRRMRLPMESEQRAGQLHIVLTSDSGHLNVCIEKTLHKETFNKRQTDIFLD